MSNLVRPIGEYLDTYYFEMFSKAGETACKSVVKAGWKKIEGKRRITEEELYDFIREKMEKKAVKFPEIFDTEPRQHIYYLMRKKAEEVGYDFSNYF